MLSFDSRQELERYDREVERYKNEVEQYRQCLANFIQAQYDAIMKHQAAADDAKSEWREFIGLD